MVKDMNNRYGRGLILAITTPKSLRVKNKEIYYVQSESRPQTKYRGDDLDKKRGVGWMLILFPIT
jgi:hypothetical protein